MERIEKIKQFGWYQMIILRALVSSGIPYNLTTRELTDYLEEFFKKNNIKLNTPGSRQNEFSRKMQLLLDLDIVKKTKGAINVYSLNRKYLDCAIGFSNAISNIFETEELK